VASPGVRAVGRRPTIRKKYNHAVKNIQVVMNKLYKNYGHRPTIHQFLVTSLLA
jgi:hypothetical protein